MNDIAISSPGRQPFYGEPMVKLLVSVSASQRAFLDAQAKDRGCSVAWLVREAIEALRDRQTSP